MLSQTRLNIFRRTTNYFVIFDYSFIIIVFITLISKEKRYKVVNKSSAAQIEENRKQTKP